VPYVLALDEGTTSARAALYDDQGRRIAMESAPIECIYPQPGWVEQDANGIWSAQLAATRRTIASARIRPSEIAAIGITNQRETTVVWDRRTGEPIAPAIVWQCRRTAAYCDALEARDLIEHKTGLVIDAYFSASKIRWMIDYTASHPRDLLFGNVDTWLIWKLTNGAAHLTDPTNASRTMLMNLTTGEWDHELLSVFGLPPEMMPKIVRSSGVCATAAAEHLGVSIPIAGIAGDQQAALFGQACFTPGLTKNTYGTGCFALMHADTGGAYVVPAFVGLGAPYWDSNARGILSGITAGTDRARLVRATLESIAFQTADLIAAMEADSGHKLKELRVDGGAAANNFLMQFQADILGSPIVRPADIETTALGAAYLAGLATGIYRSLDDIAKFWKAERVFEPQMRPDRREELLAGWRHAVARCRA
jgi:glycerol kinase